MVLGQIMGSVETAKVGKCRLVLVRSGEAGRKSARCATRARLLSERAMGRMGDWCR